MYIQLTLFLNKFTIIFAQLTRVEESTSYRDYKINISMKTNYKRLFNKKYNLLTRKFFFKIIEKNM